MPISNSPQPSLEQMKGGLVKAAVGDSCQRAVEEPPRQQGSDQRLKLTLDGVLECGVQVVDNLGKDVGGPLIAILI